MIKDCWDPSETVSDHLVHMKLQDTTRDPRLHKKLEKDQDSLDIPVEIPDEDLSDLNFAVQYDNVCCHATVDPWNSKECLRGITIMERSMKPLNNLLRIKGSASDTPMPPQSIKSISGAMISDTLAKDLQLWDGLNGPKLEDRQRRRTIFKTCGVDILWFGSAREMFHGLVGAVVGE